MAKVHQQCRGRLALKLLPRIAVATYRVLAMGDWATLGDEA